MKRSSLMAALLAGLLASPNPDHQRDAMQLLPRKPRTGRNGMRRAERYEWNGTENERRRNQIERGVLRSASRGRPAGGLIPQLNPEEGATSLDETGIARTGVGATGPGPSSGGAHV